MKNIKLYFAFFGVLFAGHVFAQHPPVHSMYMFDQLMINPAYAGAHVQLSATAMHRNQWQNFPGAPSTSTITAQSTIAQNKIGLGLLLTHDVIGSHVDQNVYFSYSYKLKLPVGELNMGLQAGVQSLKTYWDDLTLKSSLDPNFTGVLSALNPNFGTGLFYSNKEFYAGLSVPYLLNSMVVDRALAVLSESKRNRIYYLSLGNTWDISPLFKFIPSALIRVHESAPLSFDLNTHFVYQDAVGLGVGYRLVEGFVTMFELKLNENLHVGYAYDITASDIQKYSGGSHEIMINYRYRIPSLHKGLECPSYF